MKSKTIKVAMGINEGYFHNNENDQVNMERLVQDVCHEFYIKTETAISFLVYPAKVCYETQFGCPLGGENVYILEATANPIYVTNINYWEEIAKDILYKLKEILKQSTITINVTECEVEYVKD